MTDWNHIRKMVEAGKAQVVLDSDLELVRKQAQAKEQAKMRKDHRKDCHDCCTEHYDDGHRDGRKEGQDELIEKLNIKDSLTHLQYARETAHYPQSRNAITIVECRLKKASECLGAASVGGGASASRPSSGSPKPEKPNLKGYTRFKTLHGGVWIKKPEKPCQIGYCLFCKQETQHLFNKKTEDYECRICKLDGGVWIKKPEMPLIRGRTSRPHRHLKSIWSGHCIRCGKPMFKKK